jgi:hypothetical protein
MFAWARACVAAICCASLALTGLAGAQTEYDVPRGGDWKKYEGNPRWSADAVYSRDDDLGTPPSQPPQFSPWWDVAGEKVRVVSRWTRSGRFQGRSDYNLTFFGLENDKGKVLLPVVFKDVVVAPGVGLFVRSYLGEQRYERLDLKTGRRTPVEGLIDVDVIQAGPTMGTSIFSYAVGEVNVKPLRASRSEDYGPAMRPSANKVPEGRVEIYGPDGQLKRVFDRLLPYYYAREQPLYWSTQERSRPLFIPAYSSEPAISVLAPGGGQAMQRLNASFEPVGKVYPVTIEVTGMGELAPAPDVPDAWVQITKDGQMSAPPGTLAVRPLGDGGMSEAFLLASAYENRQVYSSLTVRWLVAFPSADGAVLWGYLDEASKQPVGPLWRDVIHLQTEITRDGWAKLGPQIAVQRMDGRWSLMSRTFPNMEADTYPDLASTLGAAEDKVIAMRRQELQQAAAAAARAQVDMERERWERWNNLRAAGHWQELKQVSEAWGGEFYSRWVAGNASPSVDQIKRARLQGGAGLSPAEWDERMQQAELRQAEDEKRALEASLEQLRIDADRRLRASLYTPDFSSYSTAAEITQRMIDHQRGVAAQNCAVADMGGLRICNR